MPVSIIIIQTLGSLDREIRSTHTFRVSANEAVSGRSSITQMTIEVTDDNDNTPTFDRSYFNLTVEEDEEVAIVNARGFPHSYSSSEHNKPKGLNPNNIHE